MHAWQSGGFSITMHAVAAHSEDFAHAIAAERLRDAGTDATAIGFERARELIEESRSRASGLCLVAPFRRPLDVLELIA
jgi:propanediol dehydratase small subunit